MLWLARELKSSPTWEDRIIVVVSHDRFFLDEVCATREPASNYNPHPAVVAVRTPCGIGCSPLNDQYSVRVPVPVCGGVPSMGAGLW